MKRETKRDAPEWVECDCGGRDIEQLTFSDCPDEHIYDGDDFTCRECGATGVGSVYQDAGTQGTSADVVFYDAPAKAEGVS